MFRRLMLVVAATAVASADLTAQEIFAGYDSFCGLPVVIGFDAQTASARRDQWGNPFIHVDPSVARNWSASRMFTLAHECAHHLLGHTSRIGEAERFTGGPRRQELEADCWAAQALLRVGAVHDITRAVITRAAQGHFSAGGYPTGLERARYVQDCASTDRPCRIVTEYENRTTYVTRLVPTRVPCTHVGCGPYGCSYLHPFHVVQVPQQIPEVQRVPVQRRVCR